MQITANRPSIGCKSAKVTGYDDIVRRSRLAMIDVFSFLARPC
ncbi:MAG: hypothetical protein K0S65_5272 [Labilithrix sp.]|nr:hypothetical protein [Labilithrix sp.]